MALHLPVIPGYSYNKQTFRRLTFQKFDCMLLIKPVYKTPVYPTKRGQLKIALCF